MKAAIVNRPGQTPVYGEFQEPQAQRGQQLLRVSAAALTHLTRGRAAGSHYSAAGTYPFVAGVDGVGRTELGHRVFFLAPEPPFGAMAEKVLVRPEHCVAVPDGLDDVTAAALGNPGMSCVAALKLRAGLKPGETVLVNGATGSAGTMAVQIAKYFGAKKVIATGRDAAVLDGLKKLGADVTINLTLGDQALGAAFKEQVEGEGVDIILDYLFGKSAELLLTVAATSAEMHKPLRFVQIGSASGSEIGLRAEMLRKIPITLLGSGLGSVPLKDLAAAIGQALEAAVTARMAIATRAVPLANVEETWNADSGKDRVVFVVNERSAPMR